MPLDPENRALLDLRARAGLPPLHALSPQEARNLFRETALPLARQAAEEVGKVEDRVVPGPDGDIPVRVYTPRAGEPLGILVYFHGGGWVIGDLDTYDAVCRTLANATPCTVVSVDYRLAPEHKFPAALEDCYAATAWAARHWAGDGGTPPRIAVGGDSAGGNMAAVVPLLARERGGPALCYQVLIYPVTDMAGTTPSKVEFAEGYLLDRDDARWFAEQYLNRPEEALHPHVSPLRAPDLRGLPAALIITAEYDPLRDEGEAYAVRLQQAGVPATCIRWQGQLHGFVSMNFHSSRVALGTVAAALRQGFLSAENPRGR
ncbi:MAG TPA: alpha/beta hydrolase [Thermaerobacter sp.]